MENLINKFKAGQTYLESYRIIRDFVALVKKIRGAESLIRKDGNKILAKKLELNNHKNDYDDIYRGEAMMTLHQFDIGFQYKQLIDVYWAMKHNDTIDMFWLYRRRDPNGLISEADKQEYLLYLKKVFEEVKPLLVKNGQKKESEPKLFFDVENSVLHFSGQRIKIARQDKMTNAHKILKYLLVDKLENLKDDSYYSEIAADEFGDENHAKSEGSWRKYYTACEEIQEKIRKSTPDKIEDFLIFNSGKAGRVRINPKYLA